MASKVLETIIRARDEASSILRNVGGAAKDTGAKLKEMDSLAESAHGLHKALRTAERIGLAFEVIPVGVDAVKAAFEALKGTASDSATAQQSLIESIKQFPLVGRLAGEATEFFGDKVADMFGKQHTSEVVAQLKEREDALKKFASDLPKIFEDIHKSDFAASILALTPGDADIAKVNEKLKASLQENFSKKNEAWSAISPLDSKIDEKRQELENLKSDAKRYTIGGVGVDPFFTSNDEREAIKKVDAAKVELDKLVADRKAAQSAIEGLNRKDATDTKQSADEIAKIKQANAARQRAFDASILSEAVEGQDRVLSLRAQLDVKLLDGQNRGYEARLSALKAAGQKEIETIREDAEKKIQARQGEIDALRPLADKHDLDALTKISALEAHQATIKKNRDDAIALSAKGTAQDAANAKDAQERAATLANLTAQADAGDVLARLSLDRLNTTRQQAAMEAALRAIGDTDAIAAMKATNEKVIALNLAGSELEILKARAALGDTAAELAAHELELTQQRTAAEAKLNAIIADANASEADRANAKKQLAEQADIPKIENLKGQVDLNKFILNQEASAGNKMAAMQLRKIELEGQFNEQRQRGLALLKAASTEGSRASIRRALATLDSTQAAAEKRIGADTRDFTGNQLVEGQYLTGVQAANTQERDPMAQVADQGKQQIDLAKQTNTLLEQLKALFSAGVQRPPKRLT